MLPSLAILASEAPVETVGAAVVAGGLASQLVPYLLKRFIKKNDDAQKEQATRLETERLSNAASFKLIHEDLGTLKAARDRAKEKDDEQGKEIAELKKEVRELRDTVIVLKAKSE